MRSTGVVRAIDKMGRVVIPKEIRKQMHMVDDIDSFEIFVEDDHIILRKYQPTCVFCNDLIDTVEYDGYTVCKKCIEKLNSIKDQAE